jgi:hypothetical protein
MAKILARTLISIALGVLVGICFGYEKEIKTTIKVTRYFNEGVQVSKEWAEYHMPYGGYDIRIITENQTNVIAPKINIVNALMFGCITASISVIIFLTGLLISKKDLENNS